MGSRGAVVAGRPLLGVESVGAVVFGLELRNMQ